MIGFIRELFPTLNVYMSLLLNCVNALYQKFKIIDIDQDQGRLNTLDKYNSFIIHLAYKLIKMYSNYV